MKPQRSKFRQRIGRCLFCRLLGFEDLMRTDALVPGGRMPRRYPSRTIHRCTPSLTPSWMSWLRLWCQLTYWIDRCDGRVHSGGILRVLLRAVQSEAQDKYEAPPCRYPQILRQGPVDLELRCAHGYARTYIKRSNYRYTYPSSSCYSFR
ncbi:hypothetical protein BC834DRAFT_577209 [Gloeopeniophorella convolvens]|nr:hypothetical protein BC834DRAFT_577209 [Gloeopeniophorella convolvens]